MSATYVFKCRECPWRSESESRDPSDVVHEHSDIVRDYRAEGVGATGMVEMKRQREQGLDGLSGKREYRDLFLPTAAENRTREDPTGEKYIREWNDTHDPRPTNKTPLRPELPDGARKTFAVSGK